MEVFQSTLPAGEATANVLRCWQAVGISIHASRGGSDFVFLLHLVLHLPFQSTLPAGEATIPQLELTDAAVGFQSTLPAGEATSTVEIFLWRYLISIHASRGGSDILSVFPGGIPGNFNPRFPRGKRPRTLSHPLHDVEFQSTLPAGEATIVAPPMPEKVSISIHASRGGSDLHAFPCVVVRMIFQSTLPAGEATNPFNDFKAIGLISIHASRGGSD